MSTLTEVRERPQGAHVREHGSVLADAEKRLLVWLAHRLPRRLNADHLTAIGAFGFWLYRRGSYPAAWACLAVYSLTGISSLAHFIDGSPHTSVTLSRACPTMISSSRWKGTTLLARS